MYKWLSDFLFNRTARVKLDGTISRQVKLREGIPQGGVVSPTLFLVYMNDITTTVPRHVSNTLHANDFAVWCAEEHTTTAVHRIQNTINEVCSWTESWALQLNTTKTASTLFTLSTAKEKVSLKINNQSVPQVEKPTFLGVTLDTCLTWKPHLEAAEAKATRKLAIMKKLAGTTWGGGGGGATPTSYNRSTQPDLPNKVTRTTECMERSLKLDGLPALWEEKTVLAPYRTRSRHARHYDQSQMSTDLILNTHI